MKTIFIFSAIFCTALMHVRSEMTEEEVSNALSFCLEERSVEEHESQSAEDAYNCFHTCIAIQTGRIKDKKFNQEKNLEYILATQNAEDVKEVIAAYQSCVCKMPDIEDECRSFNQLEECVMQITDKLVFYV